MAAAECMENTDGLYCKNWFLCSKKIDQRGCFSNILKINNKIMNGKEDKSNWAIGGGILAGLGAGFFFLHQSALMFVGAMLLGLGIGLIITSVLSSICSNKK